VQGILSLMDAKTNEPVNIGNPHEVTIEEIARTIVQLVGSTSNIVYRALPVDDPKQRRPDITRARQLLGWEPTIGLEDGLRKSIEYFKSKTA
jgi:dTDP-glucose 4,6-dehydratase